MAKDVTVDIHTQGIKKPILIGLLSFHIFSIDEWLDRSFLFHLKVLLTHLIGIVSKNFMIWPFKKKEEQERTVKDGTGWTDWTEGFLCKTGFDGEAEWTPPSEEGNWCKHFSGLQKMRGSHSRCNQNGSRPIVGSQPTGGSLCHETPRWLEVKYEDYRHFPSVKNHILRRMFLSHRLLGFYRNT